MRVSRILAADEAQVVIPVTAHLRLLGHGKCMTPTVRSLDGVARALLCVELKPCRLHVTAPMLSDLPDLQKRSRVSDEGGD
jgi:hypothetical protein